MKCFVLISFFLASSNFLLAQLKTTYTYDKLNRMTRLTLSDCKFILYQYDNEGNRLTQRFAQISTIDSIVKACHGQSNGSIYLKPATINNRYGYKWSNGRSGANLMNVQKGDYTVIITDSLYNVSCSIRYTLPEFPNDSFRMEKKDVTCAGMRDGQIQIIKDSSTTGAFRYQWSTGAQSPILLNLSKGIVSLAISNLVTGCVKTFKIEVDEPRLSSGIALLYPNPTTGIANLEICTNQQGKAQASVYNMLGQQIATFSQVIYLSTNYLKIDLNRFPPGIYTIYIRYNNTEIKRVIQKL